MKPFVYSMLPGRIVFGDGRAATLGDELDRLGLSRVLLLGSSRRLASIDDFDVALGGRAAGLFEKIAMHVPNDLRREVVDEGRRLGVDGAVAVGGGSTIGLAKAIALALDLPIVAVPTTYSGSEMTPIWGVTEDGIKKTGRDPKVLPRAVIYDPILVADMPLRIAAPSGINALAHCVEALYAEDANPITSMMAEEGIRALATGLGGLGRAPGDREAAGQALYGAWLAGASLAAVGMALHHKLCHTLGGSFNLPHAEVHTIVLPHVTAYNAAAAPGAVGRVSRALESENAAGALFDLAERLGAPVALETLGMKESDLDQAADLAVENPYYNPRPVERDALRHLLDDAFHGRRPQ